MYQIAWLDNSSFDIFVSLVDILLKSLYWGNFESWLLLFQKCTKQCHQPEGKTLVMLSGIQCSINPALNQPLSNKPTQHWQRRTNLEILYKKEQAHLKAPFALFRRLRKFIWIFLNSHRYTICLLTNNNVILTEVIHIQHFFKEKQDNTCSPQAHQLLVIKIRIILQTCFSRSAEHWDRLILL